MQQAFDTIAKGYDASFTHSKIGTAQREIVWSYLERALQNYKELNILELNCGTGEDALWFAQKGHKVLATDLSEKMLEISKEKLNEAGLSSSVRTMRIDINKIENAGINEKFDLVFSNFGGMNCISLKEMEKLPSEIQKFLKPSSRLIMIIMPEFCLWETVYYIFKLNFQKAFRRISKKGSVAKLNGSELKTFYFSPGRIRKLFSKNFTIVAVKPIGFFIPPSYLESFFANKSKFFNSLKKLETLVYKFPVFSSLSDHFLIDFRLNNHHRGFNEPQ